MFCPKCHTELEDNVKYCKRCGTEQKKKRRWNQFSSSKTFERMNGKTIQEKEVVEETVSKEDHNETHSEQYNYSKNYSNVENDKKQNHSEQYNYSTNYSNASQKQITSEKDYRDAYIGPNAALIEKQTFSILTAFFGPFYLMCRKLWTQAILLIILFIISYMYIPDNVGMFLRVIINLIAAIKFKETYLTEVDKRITQIKSQNPDKSSNELLDECRKKGGIVNPGYIIILFTLYLIIVGILLNQEEYKEEVQKQPIETQKQLQEMKYEIDDKIIEKDSYTNYKYYIDRKESGSCYVAMSTTSSSKTSKEYIKDLVDIYDSYVAKDITEIDLNGKKGNYFQVTYDTNKREIYVIKNKQTIYEIIFTDNNYKENNCNSTKSKILNSIEWEEKEQD